VKTRKTPPLPLPDHLGQLLELPWNPTANRQIDRWLWYIEREFNLGEPANG
jgi:hypothetical protein